MKLYYSPGACSLSPHIVAREAGIPLELVKVDLKAKTTEAGGDYNAVNPKGYVPALELEDGSVLTEGPAIVQYLADRKPERKLAPPNGALERYRLQEWLGFINSEIHKTYSPLFKDTTPAETRAERLEYLRKRYGFVEQALSKQPYLLGKEFSVADAYLFTVTNWAKSVKLDLAAYPHLEAFQQRIAARPAVQDALLEEGLGKSKRAA
jgi:glutathione S-transferase